MKSLHCGARSRVNKKLCRLEGSGSVTQYDPTTHAYRASSDLPVCDKLLALHATCAANYQCGEAFEQTETMTDDNSNGICCADYRGGTDL
jgi:hypothetical protein